MEDLPSHYLKDPEHGHYRLQPRLQRILDDLAAWRRDLQLTRRGVNEKMQPVSIEGGTVLEASYDAYVAHLETDADKATYQAEGNLEPRQVAEPEFVADRRPPTKEDVDRLRAILERINFASDKTTARQVRLLEVLMVETGYNPPEPEKAATPRQNVYIDLEHAFARLGMQHFDFVTPGSKSQATERPAALLRLENLRRGAKINFPELWQAISPRGYIPKVDSSDLIHYLSQFEVDGNPLIVIEGQLDQAEFMIPDNIKLITRDLPAMRIAAKRQTDKPSKH